MRKALRRITRLIYYYVIDKYVLFYGRYVCKTIIHIIFYNKTVSREHNPPFAFLCKQMLLQYTKESIFISKMALDGTDILDNIKWIICDSKLLLLDFYLICNNEQKYENFNE